MRRGVIERGFRRGSVATLLIAGALILSVSSAAQQAPSSTPKRGDARPPVAGKKATFTGTTKVIMESEDAMGMLRSVEELDAINTMEFWATGISYDLPAQPNGKAVAYKTEYHANIGYNPPGYRLEITRTKADGTGAAQKSLEVVSDKYAWNESELGAGLIPGKGVATPTPGAFKQRLLQLWVLPYGAVKAAVSAEGQTQVSSENGATVLTFPLSGALKGLTAKVTLDNKKMVSSVETMSADPALHDLVLRITYSDYGDYGEAASDLQFPKHIVETRDGHTVLELTVSKDDPYNPYEIFRTPANIVQAESALANPPNR
jgi:hypothetical protein